jgi:hypothetical protein
LRKRIWRWVCERVAYYFDSVCPCSELSESEEVDIWSVGQSLIDDSLCTWRRCETKEGGRRWKTYFDLISLSPRTRLERI